MFEKVATVWFALPGYARSTAWILLITVALIFSVALLTLWERKVIGWIQLRQGPNRVRIFGLLPGVGQPFADVVKLLLKEVIIPMRANKALFILAPALALIPAFATWAVIPLSPELVVANIDAGLLYVLSLTSVGVYGIILAGWAANSKYAFLGAMRSAAQIVAYEIAMGFALVGVLMVSGSLNLGTIVRTQARRAPGVELVLALSAARACISSRVSPRPTVRPLTSPRASRRSSRAFTSSTPASRSRSSSSPNTRT